MLKPSLHPSPLIDHSQREPIRIIDKPMVLRFRGLYVLWSLAGLLLHIAWLRLFGRLDMKQVGTLVRAFCQNMGVLWIKVGQLVSIRRDLFAQEICDELVKLQDQADGFSLDAARSIVESELQSSLRRCFSEFEQAPFAAASISQIHKARLRHEGVRVAVKIRRPDIETTFVKDMQFIRRIARVLIYLSIKPHARWNDLVWEIEQVMREELDYRFEATNMKRMKKTLRPHNVHVPKVFWSYSTQRVLVMEYIDGVTMSDYLKVSRDDPQRISNWLAENHIKPKRVARRIVHSHLRQSFEDNLFHGDLHPGNIMLLKRSQIAFIDFGSIGFLERDFLRKYDLYTQALRNRQYSKMADLYFLFAINLPPIDLSEVKDEFIRLMHAFDERRRVREFHYRERSLGTLNRDLIRLLGKYGIALDWTFLRVMRTWFTMDISLSELMPDADLRRILTSYYRQRERRARRKLVKWPPVEPGWLRATMELPRTAYEQTVYRGAVVRRLAMVFEGTTTRFARFFASIFGWAALSVLAAGLFLFSTFLYQNIGVIRQLAGTSLGNRFEMFPQLDYQLWLLIFVLLVYGYRCLRNLTKSTLR